MYFIDVKLTDLVGHPADPCIVLDDGIGVLGHGRIPVRWTARLGLDYACAAADGGDP